MSTYLSTRKRQGDPDKVNFYAVSVSWDKESKSQIRKQTFLGSKLNGAYKFNEKAKAFRELFIGTPHEEDFVQWQKESELPSEECFTLSDIQRSESKNAGLDLLFSHVAEPLGLKEKLDSVFGAKKAADLLSLAYYCASEGTPLYRASIWSTDQLLPCEGELSEAQIAQILATTTQSDILTFLTEWAAICKPEERLSLDITSISSYGKNNEDVMLGYNRDSENLPQINLLMLVSQTTKLPVWFEQLPGAVSDVTTLKDTVQLIEKAKIGSRKLVLDRGFASKSNISCLLKHRFKFTLGLPLYRFTEYREMVKEAYIKNEFCNPSNILTLFDDCETAQTQGVSRLLKFDGHRVWLHMYYTDYYRTRDNEIFMLRLKDIEEKLKRGEKLSSPKEQEIAAHCFKVTCTPKRGIKVVALTDKIAEFRDNDSGFFAIMSNQFKDPGEALTAYKLRDGIEKRFDDLKNEADLKRLRMHSTHNQYARLFVQFLAEILRCRLLNLMQTSEGLPKKIKTVSDLIWEMKSIRRIRIRRCRCLYKRPTKNQLAIIKSLGIGLDPSQWSPL